MNTKWSEKLISLIEVLEEQLAALGVSDARSSAQRVAVEVLDRAIGGDGCYMPRSSKIKAFLRDESIWTEFNGYNKEALARKYDVSVRYIEILTAKRTRNNLG